ncbi:SEC-C domain-containing protein [Fervidibacillus halotolerans]|uniref:SEC-C domain-containing protein n=1 Tax=Fervidibacillus halotolerans TaxID=2980027 RepID=A0A9E8M0M4_9BACI|nr:SEC-C domain-containing protein [Fervidibacillus halotolerans]WAA12740.1 SEC-C domain-containing protein [Fervidibacillus halotolerans]
MAIGRNDPCPCGSGKKYKHCCGKTNVVSLNYIILDELKKIQFDILSFADQYLQNMDMKNLRKIAPRIKKQHISDDMLDVLFSYWYILNGKTKDGQPILKTFVAKEISLIQRSKTRSIVGNWPGNLHVAFGLVEKINPQKFEIFDWLSERTYTVYTKEDIVDHTIHFTLLLPFENGNWFQIGPPLNISPRFLTPLNDWIYDAFETSGKDDPESFLREEFILLFNELMGKLKQLDCEENETALEKQPKEEVSIDIPIQKAIEIIKWKKPVYRQVIEELLEDVEMLGSLDDEIPAKALALWFTFCEEKQPTIKKPDIYIAALIYTFQSLNLLQTAFTYSKLATMYGVSSSSISKVANEMMDFFYEKALEASEGVQYRTLQEPRAVERTTWLLGLQLQEEEFDRDDETQSFFENKQIEDKLKTLTSPRHRAQALLYDAFESEGEEKLNLAKEALKIYSNSPDAYTILAEFERDEEAAFDWLEKGVKVGSEEWKEEMKDRNYPFWSDVETRPFMRAKYNYALLAKWLGKISDAITQFEELLKLNPNDNQGARYLLIPYCIQEGMVQKTKQIIEQYGDEDTVFFHMYTLMIELELNGITPTAKSIWKKMLKRNRYITDYLTGKKKLPEEIPFHYSFGSKEEAEILVEEIYDILIERKKIREGLTKLLGEKLSLH